MQSCCLVETDLCSRETTAEEEHDDLFLCQIEGNTVMEENVTNSPSCDVLALLLDKM